jgi:hypothetical protein
VTRIWAGVDRILRISPEGNRDRANLVVSYGGCAPPRSWLDTDQIASLLSRLRESSRGLRLAVTPARTFVASPSTAFHAGTVVRKTSLGVAISCHRLPDGRLDWVLSASHPRWSAETARRLAADLWPGGEVVLGRTPGVIHVIAARADRASA